MASVTYKFPARVTIFDVSYRPDLGRLPIGEFSRTRYRHKSPMRSFSQDPALQNQRLNEILKQRVVNSRFEANEYAIDIAGSGNLPDTPKT